MFNPALFCGASQVSGVATDPSWASVVVSLPLTLDLTDLKGHTFTAAGNAAVTGGYLVTDGNGDYISASASADFDLSTGDFTWEWVMQWTGAEPLNQYLFGVGANTKTRIQVGSVVSGFRLFGETAEIGTGEPFVPTVGTDYYFAFKRSGTTVTSVFGTTQGTATTTLTASCGTSAQAFGANAELRFGNTFVATTLGVIGKERYIRITKGVARDISVVPTMPFPTS